MASHCGPPMASHRGLVSKRRKTCSAPAPSITHYSPAVDELHFNLGKELREFRGEPHCMPPCNVLRCMDVGLVERPCDDGGGSHIRMTMRALHLAFHLFCTPRKTTRRQLRSSDHGKHRQILCTKELQCHYLGAVLENNGEEQRPRLCQRRSDWDIHFTQLVRGKTVAGQYTVGRDLDQRWSGQLQFSAISQTGSIRSQFCCLFFERGW